MNDYKWIHPPLKLVEDYDESLPLELQIVQDDLNDNEVSIYSFEVPGEDRKMYSDEFFTPAALVDDREAHEAGDDVEPVEYITGFFISGSADGYSDDDRDPLKDPQANDVFVHTSGPEHDAPGVYLPIGQHAEGSYKTGDYLISIEDDLAISRGIYTPAVYTCEVVLNWDPHKALRPHKETA